jgi:orotate phosphoribosyltransferase
VTPSETLIAELREHALVIGEVTLTSGATAQYYVDAKRAILRPAGFTALAELVAGFAREWEATAVGGLTMGADAPACAALAGGAPVKAFFVRKETKAHGLQRKVEGPPLEPGERCLIVEDVVTTGGSTVQAIEAVRAAPPRSYAPLRGRRTSRWRRSTRCTRTARIARSDARYSRAVGFSLPLWGASPLAIPQPFGEDRRAPCNCVAPTAVRTRRASRSANSAGAIS